MGKFRKKPVVIEAFKFDGTHGSAQRLMMWMEVPQEARNQRVVAWGLNDSKTTAFALIIPTLEGDHTASPGDWIIKGVKGEFYPCKPDIFVATYEPVPEEKKD